MTPAVAERLPERGLPLPEMRETGGSRVRLWSRGLSPYPPRAVMLSTRPVVFLCSRASLWPVGRGPCAWNHRWEQLAISPSSFRALLLLL